MLYKHQKSNKKNKHPGIRPCFSDEEIIRIRIHTQIVGEIFLNFSRYRDNQMKIEFSDTRKNGSCTFTRKTRGSHPNYTRSCAGDLNLPDIGSQSIDVPLELKNNAMIFELKKIEDLEESIEAIDSSLIFYEKIEDINEDISNYPNMVVWFDEEEREICFRHYPTISNTKKAPPHA